MPCGCYEVFVCVFVCVSVTESVCLCECGCGVVKCLFSQARSHVNTPKDESQKHQRCNHASQKSKTERNTQHNGKDFPVVKPEGPEQPLEPPWLEVLPR